VEKEIVPETLLSVPLDNRNTPVIQSQLHLLFDIFQESDEVHPDMHTDRLSYSP
jgi:hypothetical protein